MTEDLDDDYGESESAESETAESEQSDSDIGGYSEYEEEGRESEGK